MLRLTATDVRLAQLDRAFGYGPKGRGFESSSARYTNLVKSRKNESTLNSQGAFFICYESYFEFKIQYIKALLRGTKIKKLKK